VSADSGRTWSDSTASLPGDVVALHDVDCPKFCYLTATEEDGSQVVLVMSNGTFTSRPIAAPDVVAALSCASETHCTATDGQTVFVTHDSAQTWTTSRLDAFVYTTPALSCVTGTRRCWVVGDNGETPVIEMSTNDSKTWQPQDAPAELDGLYGLDCPAANTCYGVGADFDHDDAMIVGTRDAGATWESQQLPTQAYPLRSVACVSIAMCWASGLTPADTPDMFATVDGGSTWAAQEMPGAVLTDAPRPACTDQQTCTAVSGGLALSTDDGGQTGDGTELPATVSAPQSLSCPTRRRCVGVSNDALDRPAAVTTSDGGPPGWTTTCRARRPTCRQWSALPSWSAMPSLPAPHSDPRRP
jgi:photosystem II stability/assembly factor-like uncharacterized protein